MSQQSQEAQTQRPLLQMAPEMTIYQAAQIKQTLLDALVGTPTLEIDLSNVCEIDSAGVQLLLAAARHAREHGGALVLSGHSPAVIDTFELLDLVAHFGDPVVIPHNRHQERQA